MDDAKLTKSSPKTSPVVRNLRQQYLSNQSQLEYKPVAPDAAVLPIEKFKEDPRSIFPKPLYKTFLSSGTTQQDRAQSQFSREGIGLYRDGAIQTFIDTLSEFFSSPLQTRGFSLIPDRDEWPDSSLAQMLSWIASQQTVVWGDWEQAGQLDWLFGTGFHFVDLFDSGFYRPLPPHAVVFETGGTKGKTRNVERHELHQMICEMFAIDENRIISEYGMCELACQAYEFSTSKGRWFRFPAWVKVGVQQDSSVIKSEGLGALVIEDPLRVDCPMPIRTQDFVELDPSGGFKLLGRLPHTILKGCSLNVEDLLTPAVVKSDARGTTPITAGIDASKLQFTKDHFNKWLHSKEVLQSLADFFNSQLIANQAIEDLASDIPQSDQAWQEMLENLCQPESDNWLIVSPQTHPLAVLYPIIVGNCFHLDIQLRTLHRRCRFFELLQNFIRNSGGNLTLIPASYRISEQSTTDRALLVFGSSSTIQVIRQSTAQPVQGFGSFLSGNIVDQDSLPMELAAIRRDITSLGGLGCLSSRVVFLIERETSDGFLHWIQAWEKEFEKALLPLAQRIRNFQAWENLASSGHYSRSGHVFIKKTFQPDQDISSYLEDIPGCIPIVLVKKRQTSQLEKFIFDAKDISKIATSLPIPSIESVAPGSLNQTPWDGKLHGIPLFVHRNHHEAH